MRRTIAAFAIVTLFAAFPAVAEPTTGRCEPDGASNNSKATATSIEAPAACSAALTNGDADFYRFDLPTEGRIDAQVTGVDLMPTVRLERLSTNEGADCPGGRCQMSDAEAGTWTIGVTWATGTAGDYTLLLTTVSLIEVTPPTTACDSAEADAGNAAPGKAITTPAACTGTLADEMDPADWYTFDVAAGSAISVLLARQSGVALSVQLKPESGPAVPCTNDAASACLVPSAAAGKWNLGITRRVVGVASSSYVLAVAVVNPAGDLPSTCEEGAPSGDAGSDKATAHSRSANTACIGALRDGDDADVFKINLAVTPGDIAALVVSVTPVNGSAYPVSVFDNATAQAACQALRVTVCSTTTATNGDWFIKIERGTGAAGSYMLSITSAVGSPSSIQPTVETLVNTALSDATCEVGGADAGSERTATATPLRWRSATETATLCRGSVLGSDTVDVYRFQVRTDTATVRVMLQPESPMVDLTLRLTPPPGACEPEERQGGFCPDVVSTIGRNGTPDFAERAVTNAAKSGFWFITVGRSDPAVGGYYELGVHVQGS